MRLVYSRKYVLLYDGRWCMRIITQSSIQRARERVRIFHVYLLWWKEAATAKEEKDDDSEEFFMCALNVRWIFNRDIYATIKIKEANSIH